MRTVCGVTRRRSRLATSLAAVALLAAVSSPAAAQSPEPATREATIEVAQADKLPGLSAYVPKEAERLMVKVQNILEGTPTWHPYFENAYRGGGLAFGAGYQKFVSGYNFVDVRASYTLIGYKRAEAEFVAPRLFDRRGHLSVLGGWREATQVGFFGLGDQTSVDNRTNFLFRQPYASALLTVKPTRRLWILQGGIEWTQWDQRAGEGSYPSIETKYTPTSLPGLGSRVTYLHSQGTAGFDWRTSPGYSRRGGYYGVTVHDYNDRDHAFGFERVDYEAIQHIPIFREAWTLSFRGRASTTTGKDGQDIPFFMLPSLGGGSELRGFDSWRFRDRHSLLLQAEWRVMVNRFLDTALFYDAGKVADRVSDLDLHQLKSDYGFGVRFHGPFATPLRIDIARSNEATAIVFGTSVAF